MSGAGGTIRIGFAYPPRQLSPNTGVHHMTRHRFKKAMKSTAFWETRIALGRDKFEHDGGDIPVRITWHPVQGKVAPDADNAIATCKAHLDGIAQGLGVDDRHFRPSIEIGEPVPGGRVIFTLGALE
jgi:crossover junction endodeoxyribonuclease RusA